MILRAGQNVFEFPRSPLVFGSLILGARGPHENEREHLSAQLAKARALVDEGADIIAIRMDLWAVGECELSEAAEWASVRTFVKSWREAEFGEPLALGTRRLHVAEMALAIGIEFLFEPGSALCTPASSGEAYARLCAKYGAALVICYFIEGGAKAGVTADARDEVALAEDFFEVKLRCILDEGLTKESVVLCVQLGSETDSGNRLWVHAQLGRFHRFERPLLLFISRGVSNETFDGNFAELVEREAAGMVSKMVRGVMAGVQMFCGEPVKAAAEAVRTVAALLA